MIIKTATFLKSSPKVELCPDSDLPEYAFIGRSNVGKSSLINMITGFKTLAKTSGTPGKTQLINHFIINNEWHLVDLPGYGYAKVSKSLRRDFSSIITGYILRRETLCNLFVLIDCRLKPQTIDLEFIQWLGLNAIPFSIVFTKTDKIGPMRLEENVEVYRRELLKAWEELPQIYTSSAVSRAGRDQILSFIQRLNAGAS